MRTIAAFASRLHSRHALPASCLAMPPPPYAGVSLLTPPHCHDRGESRPGGHAHVRTHARTGFASHA
ncbi:hypothetical protein [Singulisphaera acidiphila]|uniref:hypothetical protein n=1 Tax=Singulisphaera acidiphila TaxID=466153 RepID=UPI0012B67AA8|nr:hypothetical protein [Singulisphaera acidiphila]